MFVILLEPVSEHQDVDEKHDEIDDDLDHDESPNSGLSFKL